MVKTIWGVAVAFGLSLGVAAAQTRELVLFPFAQGVAVQPTDEFNVNVEALNALYAQLKEIPACMCCGSERRTRRLPARSRRTVFGATA